MSGETAPHKRRAQEKADEQSDSALGEVKGMFQEMFAGLQQEFIQMHADLQQQITQMRVEMSQRFDVIEQPTAPTWWHSEEAVLVAPYTIILLLAVLGNGLVILTLAVNQRMRTVTNLFLLNLAVSDLLLGVFCMPFTLAGVLLREFVFGQLMCKLIPYLQGETN
ncbi:hypothetical protein HPB49_024590 [Dermacentor silvarum]|uniref:Uncharacterized protein n=1 Tax=Dermacentor silvarum TaxID=543639 RepID=A0ACB8D151_DERSI|nr:hypothetical protein HPB49_024590 [Dermacentor silvarum]